MLSVFEAILLCMNPHEKMRECGEHVRECWHRGEE